MKEAVTNIRILTQTEFAKLVQSMTPGQINRAIDLLKENDDESSADHPSIG